MKPLALVLLAAAIAAANAQTAPAGAGSPAKKNSMAAVPAAKSSSTTASPWIKLPAGVPRVAHGPLQTPISLHYEDVKVGTGAEGESGKLWLIKYTGWRAADGVKFDSWDEHKQPVMKDGKPVLDADGKPKMGDPDLMKFPQGSGRVIPGFDYGLAGMKIGGKRRIFIPWQLGYGLRNLPAQPAPPTGGPAFPGLPPKSDLIFDVELVDVTEMPAPMRPVMPGGGPGVHPVPAPPHPGASNQPGAAPATPAPAAPAAPAQPATPTAAPAQSATPPPAAPPASTQPK